MPYVMRSLFVAAVLLPGTVLPQSEMSPADQADQSESLFLDPNAFAGQKPGEARLDVFVQVGYDNLTFVKEGDSYQASYEITITISDSVKGQVTEKFWKEEIKGISFDESVSAGEHALLERSFAVPPGRYTVTAMIRDLESNAVKRTRAACLVPDLASPAVALSSIMIISRITVRDGKKSILPDVSSNVGDLSDAFYAFFEAYNNRAMPDTLRFVASVLDTKGETKLQTDTVREVQRGKNDVFMRIEHSGLPLGDYELRIIAQPAGIPRGREEGTVASASRRLIVRWRGLPRSMKDLDEAIEQLQYIAKDNEMSELRSGKTLEEKQKLFLEFWKKRSTNPNASRNIRMQQYYARVEYANKHFSHYREGWRTDMGLVYIMLGPPSNIERHPFEVDSKPYEIWSYYDLNYQYVFVDENGFGDYRLITPFWEVYNRRHD